MFSESARRAFCSLYSRTLKKQGHKEHVYHLTTPNATLQAPPRAAARNERRLLAVACKRLFGKAPASCAPAPGVPRMPIG